MDRMVHSLPCRWARLAERLSSFSKSPSEVSLVRNIAVELVAFTTQFEIVAIQSTHPPPRDFSHHTIKIDQRLSFHTYDDHDDAPHSAMRRCSTTLWLIRTIRIFGSIILLRRMMPCFASPMVSAWIITTSRQTFVRRTARRWANSLSSVPNDKAGSHDGNSRVAIVGGGLAGLATCHAWLSKIQNISATPLSSTRNWTITIYDTHDRPGIGGASALAGGYVIVKSSDSFFAGSRIIEIYLLLLIESTAHDDTFFITKISETPIEW